MNSKVFTKVYQRNYKLSMQTVWITLLILLPFQLFSQGIDLGDQEMDPVDWTFELDTASDGTLQVIALASIQNGWKLYSHNIEDGGPIPTDLVITSSTGVASDNEIEESGHLHGPEVDDIFGIKVSYYTEEAGFAKKIILHRSRTAISGYVLYMVCNDKQCLPPKEVPFELNLD